MTISAIIKYKLANQSWIRRMFEEGARLKRIHGEEKVFDFSLGNPNLPPPDQFGEAMRDAAATCGKRDHSYMSSSGNPVVCKSVSEHLSKEQQVEVAATDIIMTSGAAGALNVIFKTILDPGDEVIVPSPYFVEYVSFAENHGGVLKTVPTASDFSLDLSAISSAIGPKTKAVLINSPNNPTGQIYSADTIQALDEMIAEKGKRLERTIYLISDEPYRKIVYDDAVVPSIFSNSTNSIIANSYSKDISIPGERIGYAAVNPKAALREELVAGLALSNRILGFVNASAFMQRVVGCIQGLSVDISEYARKRDLICDGLSECGYEFLKPPGAFYLFPKSPIADDVAFVQALLKELILVSPGKGFGSPGYFRIAFCVDDQTIIDSLPGFLRAREACLS